MPQYELDKSGTVLLPIQFADLDAFTQGYVEAMFWTSECPGVSTRTFRTKSFQRDMEAGRADGTIPADVGFDDLAPEALKSVLDDCKAFQEANADDLTEACDNGRINGYDMANAGHDYWLTRNGHGAGFWDRGLAEVGDRLSDACRYSSVDPYFGDDGKVHI